MAQNTANRHYSGRQLAAGVGNFAAATVLWVAAVMTGFQGISALTRDEVVVVGPDYLYTFNTTAWGWIPIVVAVLLAAVAFGLFWTVTWARIAAIVIAGELDASAGSPTRVPLKRAVDDATRRRWRRRRGHGSMNSLTTQSLALLLGAAGITALP